MATTVGAATMTATTTTTTTAPDASQNPPLSAGLARWTPGIPTNLINMLNPFASGTDDLQKADKPKAETEQFSSWSFKKRPVLEPTSNTPDSPRKSSPTRSNASVMFDEPDNRSTSEDGSVEGRERLRRSIRPKTGFSICHAPPASSTRQKLHRRPRALLQLHKLSANARARPAFEVIPSANFSVRLTRAITKIFTTRHSLCTNDLVVMKAETYDGEEEDDEGTTRDVIGLICKGRKDDERTAGGKARIYLASGKEWEAYATVSGGYEFCTTDEHGLDLTVRWVQKRNKDGSKGPGKDGYRKFNFSTISPNSRRHPVIATLSKTGIDINDTYKIPEPAAATPLSTPQYSGSALAEAMEEEGEKNVCETDDELREIITVTAIWVAFKEGWSPTFKYDDKDALLTPASPTKSFASNLATPPASPGLLTMEKRRSIQSISSGLMRRTSMLSKRNSSLSTHTIGDEDDAQHHIAQANGNGNGSLNRSASISGTIRSGRARADSSSTVLVHRAASNRRRSQQQQQLQQTQQQQQQRKGLADLFAAHNQLQEVSREELPTRDGGEVEEEQQQQRPVDPLPSSTNDNRSQTPTLALLPGDQKADKRDSTATTATSGGFLEPAPPRKGGKKIRKSRSWRRLLCGASSD